MSMNRIFNFNAGPAMLPLEVLREIREGFMEFGGMSVLEISHRSKEFAKIIGEARELIRELLSIPKNYTVLFLQGGGRLEFAMVPLNLMDKIASYVVTGRWANEAYLEAKTVGDARIAYTSEPLGFSKIPRPSEIKVDRDASYLHVTSNNTIHGTCYREFPETPSEETPLVVDMTSDLFTRKVDVSRFGLIYAAAQKNAGIAGVTIVVIRNDLLDRNFRPIPSILRYKVHADAGSIYNTPPVFAIYAMRLVLSWLKKMGGVSAMEAENRRKSSLVYDVIDGSGFYRAPAEKGSRSPVNVVFNLPDERATRLFIDEAAKRKMVGLAGHRSLGGIRASMYNAFPLEGAETLADFMMGFEKQLHNGKRA